MHDPNLTRRNATDGGDSDGFESGRNPLPKADETVIKGASSGKLNTDADGGQWDASRGTQPSGGGMGRSGTTPDQPEVKH